MTTETVETSTFPPNDDWDERTERFYAGEALENPPATTAPLTPAERQHQEYGGVSVGAAFHGWLSALGVTVLLIALTGLVLAALGAAPGLSGGGTIGGTAAAVAAAVGATALVIGVFAGSYAAGRLVRFDGGRQGVAVWVLVVVSGLVAAGLVVVADAQYALRSRSVVPELAVANGDLLLWGAVTLGVAVLLTVLVAVGGGKLGVRYHAKVDRAGFEEPVDAPA